MLQFSNMLMVCGTGKKVGKTTLSCFLINNYTNAGKQVYALKTSCHMHELDAGENIIKKGEDYAVVKETRSNTKDSSKMLQAGAVESYFVQSVSEEKIFELSQEILATFPKDAIIICESGGLRDYIQPALFLFVPGGTAIDKLRYQPMADYCLTFGEDFNENEILVDIGLDKVG